MHVVSLTVTMVGQVHQGITCQLHIQGYINPKQLSNVTKSSDFHIILTIQHVSVVGGINVT